MFITTLIASRIETIVSLSDTQDPMRIDHCILGTLAKCRYVAVQRLMPFFTNISHFGPKVSFAEIA